jgi:hypothetical protein
MASPDLQMKTDPDPDLKTRPRTRRKKMAARYC